MTSETEKLRRLLDERGVEHYDGVERTLWGKDASGYRFSADELTIGSMSVHMWCDTPEQAIAATLGAGTCHDEGTFSSWGLFTCSNCSIVFPLDAVKDAPSIGRTLPPNYCPNCGRRVEQ